jgi:hypothetical protein
MPVFIALLHYPVYNRRREVVATAVTNLDVHDIARAARTFNISRFYIVTPFEEQRYLVEKIMRHWQTGYGAKFNPSRKEAFDSVDMMGSLEEVQADILRRTEKKLILVATGAGFSENVLSHSELKRKMECEEGNYLILFGTGWGIAKEVTEGADFLLEPIKGSPSYNHLSVRSAVAITLDRLFGER